MNKKKISVVVVGICISLIAILIVISVNNNFKPIHDIKPFESINVAAKPEYKIKDFERIDYSKDEEKVKKLLTEYMKFVTEEYEDSRDFEIKYESYLTQIAPNALNNYKYDIDFSKENIKVSLRDVETFVFDITDMKLLDTPNIKILSKEAKKLNYVGKDGYSYTVLMSVPVEVNRKIEENGVYKNYGGDRIKIDWYLEFVLFEYDNNIKIHTVESRTNRENLEEFESNESEESTSSVDNIIEIIKYNNNKISKYIGSSLGNSVDFSAIESLNDEEIKDISNTNIDSVVIIMNMDSNNKVQSLGTGFFLQPGIILTNCHVISGATSLKIIMHDGKECEVEGIVSANGTIDLAVIKLTKEIGRGVIFSNDISSIISNDPVLAIGHPYGNYYTITAGVFNKLINNSEVLFLQSTLPLLPGNSGGPLFDKEGNVIGINTAIDAFGNTTLSIPYTYIEDLINILSSTKFSRIKSLKEI